MSLGKQIDYDDEALVLDIARGSMTCAQIGAKHGLSDSTISAIARGERRPELQPRIKAATQGLTDEARRLGAQLARPSMVRLAQLAGVLKASLDTPLPVTIGDTDVQRKAVESLLKFTLGDPARPEVNVTQSQSNRQELPGLTEEDLEAIAARRGGPDREEHRDDKDEEGRR